MPKYHYRCENCTRDWWQWCNISQSDLDKCPHCDKPAVIKIPTFFSPNSVVEENKQVGEMVEQSIIESKKELQQEIKKMKETTYDDI